MSNQLDKLYRSIVWNLASKKINLWIKNSTQDHAAIIAEALLTHTIESIRIRTTAFDPNFYGSDVVMKGLDSLLNNTEAKVEVVCRNAPATLLTHPWITRANGSTRLSIWQETTATNLTGSDFILSDKDGIRAEQIGSNAKAKVNFGDEISVARSQIEFNEIKAQANQIY